ncbi:unnamed protein product [Soboliphyme baturini]|uniref:Transposase n=1 Tax=Soboliphyme baturini TaxID=241478 RepID=A0A183IBP5_9BILA|nr:unnamed protein product [Soboliphyme baturini]
MRLLAGQGRARRDGDKFLIDREVSRVITRLLVEYVEGKVAVQSKKADDSSRIERGRRTASLYVWCLVAAIMQLTRETVALPL